MNQNNGQAGQAVSVWNPALPARTGQALSSTFYGASPVETLSEKMQFDLSRFFLILAKHRWLISAVAVAGLLTGLVASLLMTPLYRASVTIETASQTVRVTTDESLQPQVVQDPGVIATYVELFGSRSLAERVVNQLKLADDTDFVSGESRVGPLSRVTGLLFRSGQTADPSGAESAAARQRNAINKVLANTTAKVVKPSRLLVVSYSDTNAQRAQAIANALGAGFIQANLDRRLDATSYARHFLESQLQIVKLKLEESERKVVEYADREKLVNLDNKQSLLSSQLENLNIALAKAKVDRSNAEQLWNEVKNVSDFSDIPSGAFVGNGDNVNRLRAAQSQLLSDYQEKLLTFKPGFPDMVALKRRIKDADSQIAKEVEEAKNSVHAAYELSVQREQAITNEIDIARQAFIDTRNRSVSYTMLQREADTNRTLYDGLLQRFKEIGVVGGLTASDLSVVDDADLPLGPYSPRKTFNALASLLAGLLLGIGVALALEYFDNTVKTPDQIEALLGIPVLGLIPRLEKNETLQSVLSDPHSAISEAYRSMRTALQFSTDRGVPESLVVTSARPSEGKTTSVTTLARMFGQIGTRVLIVDADLRNPSLHKVFGIENSSGLSNYLTGAVELDDVLRPTEFVGVTAVTSGPIPPNPAELLSSAKMQGLLTKSASHYDLVLIDSAPVMGLADALLLSSVADATLLVCEAGETPVETIRGTTKRILMANGQLIGGVLTKFDAKKAGYGYTYFGYEYYGYGRENQTALPEPNKT